MRQNLCLEDLFDRELVLFGDRAISKEKTRGYLILLNNSSDSFLKIASLVDGSVIDFMFPTFETGKVQHPNYGRHALIKEMINSIEEEPIQLHFVAFYTNLYLATLEFYLSMENSSIAQCCLKERYVIVRGLIVYV